MKDIYYPSGSLILRNLLIHPGAYLEVTEVNSEARIPAKVQEQRIVQRLEQLQISVELEEG